jgi:hypothetical protein
MRPPDDGISWSKSQSYIITGGLLLEAHDSRFFFHLNPRGPGPYIKSFLMRKWVCLS